MLVIVRNSSNYDCYKTPFVSPAILRKASAAIPIFSLLSNIKTQINSTRWVFITYILVLIGVLPPLSFEAAYEMSGQLYEN